MEVTVDVAVTVDVDVAVAVAVAVIKRWQAVGKMDMVVES